MELFVLVVWVLMAMAALIWLGYMLADAKLRADQVKLGEQREALRVQWQALVNARRVNDVFFQAREAMRQAEIESHALPAWSNVIDGEFADGEGAPWGGWSR
jgi:hypothetical protein